MPPATQPLTEDEILARVLYRDAMMLVLNKPPGIAVHVTGHDKVAIDASFRFLQYGLPAVPQLAHRLDRDTSGCLVLGRHRQALITLGKLFAEQQVKKRYLALVVGAPPEQTGGIERPILKSGKGSKWKLTLDDAGQPAVTRYEQLATGEGWSLLALMPETGRTHQLRLHCMGLGCPIIGDAFYGVKEGPFSASAQPMMLHAEAITVPLYHKKEPITVRAPLPEAMVRLMGELGCVVPG